MDRGHSGLAKARDFVERSYFANMEDPRHFLTIDSWDSVVALVRMREQFHDEYGDLDQTCEELTETERRVGVSEDWASRRYKPAHLN
jgi:hypothetical protein